MLTPEQIQANKERFLSLINQINIPGADIQGLIQFLESSDFFIAPASTKYHSNFDGGLCQHSLNVYDSLIDLYEANKHLLQTQYEPSTLIAVALLHDISKANFYEKSIGNKKIYSDQGSKHDNMGKFDWVAVESWVVREPENRFLAGTHEENSMLLVSRYIPLNQEEIVSILNHHCHTNDGNQFYDQSAVMNTFPLLTLLHTADVIATFIKERN